MVDFEGLMHELETHSHSGWLCYTLGRILRQNTRGRFTIRAPHRRGFRERDHDYLSRLLLRHGVVKYGNYLYEQRSYSVSRLCKDTVVYACSSPSSVRRTHRTHARSTHPQSKTGDAMSMDGREHKRVRPVDARMGARFVRVIPYKSYRPAGGSADSVCDCCEAVFPLLFQVGLRNVKRDWWGDLRDDEVGITRFVCEGCLEETKIQISLLDGAVPEDTPKVIDSVDMKRYRRTDL